MSPSMKGKAMRKNEIVRSVRHEFTDEQKLRLADSITSAVARLKSAQDAKKLADAQFKEQIDEQLVNIVQFSQLYRDGGEDRPTDCKILWNTPNVGEKTFVRLDTGEELLVEAMTMDERQEEIAFSTVAE